MTGIVHKNRQRLAIGAIYPQDGDCSIHWRGRNLSEIALEPTHLSVGIHAKAIVPDERAPVSSADLRVCEVFVSLTHRIRNFFKSGGFPCRWASGIFILNYRGGMRMRRSDNKGSGVRADRVSRSEEHTSELQSRQYLVCR